ncbi:facilitated trehalose transporter Tret1-like [Diorhabda carinulata]|uniref:facilitated trehalose transporter Tret1-like n=1 Tax=Diorhabda carinulata TaxID=1163345 RepID=UPI0025A15F97|nr:facilitated trehalose transporter Tret1-like [Diorhabda carinulata]
MKYVDCSILVVFIVDLLATTGDLGLSWTSPVYPKLYSNNSLINPLHRRITDSEDAWLGSWLNFGAILGPVLFGYISETFGRKVGLLAIAVPHVVAFLTFAFAHNIYLYYVGRFLGGVSLGGGYCLYVIYIAEISKDSNRGKMSLTTNTFCALGNFLPLVIGPFTSMRVFNLILACLPMTFLILFSIIAPESPYYLVSVKKEKEAEEALMYLRSADAAGVAEELDNIKSFIKMDGRGHFTDIFNNKILRKSFLLCLVLIASQDLSGFCAITYHLQTIFEISGTKLNPELATIVVGVALLLSSVTAPSLVDKVGRKPLIVVSCFGMFVALNLLAGFFYFHDKNINTKPMFWIPILSLMIYIIFFNVGICTVPWVLMSELFPNNLRQMTTAAASTFGWITSFIIANSFNDMTSMMGQSGTFWFFSSMSILCATITICYLPETKGKTFIQIQVMLSALPNKNIG